MSDGDGRPPESLAGRAYRLLKDRIVTCSIEPGARVTERGLALELRLGLAPVREALRRLDAEGLVVTLPRQGYVVTPLTVKSVDELFEAWRLVCGDLAETAMQKATDEQLDRIIAAHFDEPTTSDPKTVLAHGERVFDSFCEVADNPLLANFHRHLSHQMARLFVLVFRDPLSTVHMTVERGRDIEGWLRARDSVAVRRETMSFNDLVHRAVLEVLAEHPGFPQDRAAQVS